MMSWLLAKLCGLAMALLGLAGMLLGLKWQRWKRRQAEARADGLEAQMQHHKQVESVDAETERAKGELDESLKSPDGLLDYFRDGKLLRRDTEGGPS